jgi:hypothetical protein
MNTLNVVLTLVSPLVHGAFGADIGNAVAIRREPVVSIAGSPRIPCLSGSALRGTMRRIVMRDMFDRLGISRQTMDAGAWDRLYGALANGGHLDGSENAVKPDDVRALRAEIPPLSVFGAALYSNMLAGRIEVGMAWPVCRETIEARLVKETDTVLDEHYAEDLVSETSTVRHIDREIQDPEVSGITPMPVTVEALSTGSRLVCTITGTCTPLEESVVVYALERIRGVGGKGASGFGRVRVDIEGEHVTGELWANHLAEHEAELRASLLALGARVAPTTAKAKRAKAVS